MKIYKTTIDYYAFVLDGRFFIIEDEPEIYNMSYYDISKEKGFIDSLILKEISIENIPDKKVQEFILKAYENPLFTDIVIDFNKTFSRLNKEIFYKNYYAYSLKMQDQNKVVKIIEQSVAEYFNVLVGSWNVDCKKREYINCRHFIAYFCCQFTKMSLGKIGQLFKPSRSHSMISVIKKNLNTFIFETKDKDMVKYYYGILQIIKEKSKENN